MHSLPDGKDNLWSLLFLEGVIDENRKRIAEVS